jgi:mannose-1-phosphate guanylyltransferase
VAIPSERTVVVGLEGHERYLAAEFAERPAAHLLKQPRDRGTAAAILFAAEWIEARDPWATVVFCPSDHFIPEEVEFMERVAEVARFVEREPEWMVLLGAEATEPETEYGWIEPGESVGSAGDGPVYRIRRFQEKPSKEVAERLFRKGCLWNTFVFVARASVVLAAGRECVPSLADRLARLSSFWGTRHARWAIRHAYDVAPTSNFSRAILEACSQPLAVVKMPGLTWCDLGSPGRVLKTMAGCGIAVPRHAAAIA